MASCLACLACQGCAGVASICCSCLGCGLCKGGEPSRDPMVGRVRALGIMLSSVVFAVAGQYWLYQYLDDLDAWEDGCDNEDYSSDYIDTCIGNTFVYRVSFVDAVLFLILAFCACCSPIFTNGFWGFKTFLWVLGIIVVIFIPNYVFDTDGYVWVARIGAFIFTIMQQIVLVDLAYRTNDSLVEKAQEAGDDTREGRAFYAALVAASLVLYVGSLTAIGVMFHYFSGCSQNEVVMALTLILVVCVTGVQLAGSEGNLFTSGVVTAYATFLCFSAVSKTPRSACNPFVGETNVTTVIVGLALTIFSLFWVTLRASSSVASLLGGETTEVKEATGPVQETPASLEAGGDKSKPFVQTSVVAQVEGAEPAREQGRPSGPPDDGTAYSDGGLGWRSNVVMVLISMYFAMMLTNWGDINTDGESSSSKNGWVAMWLTTAGQWICFLLYGWTLIAPNFFPDRDFS